MAWEVDEDLKITMTKGDTPAFAFQALLPDGAVVTTSIGVVTAATDDTPDSLFKRADSALYEAKLIRGKNNVVVH